MAITKTWIVTSGARSRHPEMDGETVPVFEAFSNGMQYPGDGAGGVDQVAGCTCVMAIDGDVESLPDAADDPDLDDKLRGEVTDRSRVGTGMNQSEFGKIDDVDVITKNTTNGTAGVNNELTQMVNDELGGMVRIPRTTTRLAATRPQYGGHFETVSVRVMDAESVTVRLAREAQEIPDLLAAGVGVEDRKAIMLFDNIIGNGDRHMGNLLVDSNGRFWAIDHDVVGGVFQPWMSQDLKLVGDELIELTAAQRGRLESLLARESELRARIREYELSLGASGSAGAEASLDHVINNVRGILDRGSY